MVRKIKEDVEKICKDIIELVCQVFYQYGVSWLICERIVKVVGVM